MPAREFFKKLAQASSKSVITPIDLSVSVQASSVVRVAAYFRYDWTLNDGRVVDFTCVDVFASHRRRVHAHGNHQGETAPYTIPRPTVLM